LTTEAPAAETLLGSKDVAAILNVPLSTVQALSRSGDLPTVRIGLKPAKKGRTYRYRRETVEAWIAERER
jgi:excisionase family DNA binding protein